MRSHVLALAVLSASIAAAIPALPIEVELTLDSDQSATTFDRALPMNFASAGGRVLFMLAREWKNETWVSNGTAAGTEVLADLDPRPGGWTLPLGSVGSRALIMGGRLSQSGGDTIWSSGGTNTDLVLLLRDVWLLGHLLGQEVMPGYLLVASGRESATVDLVQTDGTPSGTRTIASIQRSPTSLSWEIVRSGTRIFLLEESGALWSTDGTPTGTVRVFSSADWRPDDHAFLPGVAPFKGGVVFFGKEGPGVEPGLWWSGGAPSESPRLLARLAAGELLDYEALAGRLFLVLRDGVHGDELWQTDATERGTRKLSNFAYSKAFSGDSWGNNEGLLHRAGDRWLLDIHGPGGSRTWWTLKPGQRSPRRLQGCPGGCPTPRKTSGLVASAGGRVVFVGQIPSGVAGVYSSDGTPAGTVLLPVAVQDVAHWQVVADKVFIKASGIWVTDGTARGTSLLVPSQTLFFSVGRVGSRWWIGVANELWMTDGSPAGTTKVRAPLLSHNKSSPAFAVADLGGVLFICSGDGQLLARSDGSSPTLLPVEPSSCQVDAVSPELGQVFIRNWSDGGFEYWRSNGTPAGTVRLEPPPLDPPRINQPRVQTMVRWRGATIAAIGPIATVAQPTGLFQWTHLGWSPWLSTGNSALYVAPPELSDPDFLFCANGSLWSVSPGASAAQRMAPQQYGCWWAARLGSSTVVFSGSEIVRCVVNGGCSTLSQMGRTQPEGWLPSAGRLFVVTIGREDKSRSLWRIDADGTVERLAKVCGERTRDGVGYAELRQVGSRVVIACGESGQVWSSDGTLPGTIQLMASPPGGDQGHLAPFLERLDEIALLRGYDVAHGLELWQTDGTVSGTRLLRDINPGPGSSDPIAPRATAVGVYFQARDEIHGQEIWLARP